MFTLNCKGRLLVIDSPIIMGILNATPDSFYPGSRYPDIASAVDQAGTMINEGATILDIGGQSTRPGSEQVDADEELARVIPVIRAIHEKYPDTILSVDSYWSKVAAAAIDAGASIVNDISAGSMDLQMLETVARLQVPYVLMHMRGTPQTMQQHTNYDDITTEVFDFLSFKMYSIRNAGVKDIIVDPGFGFGKTATHNFILLKQLAAFRMLNAPILLGISRKSFIYQSLAQNASDALNGTTVMHTVGLLNGANILRVHDVKAAKETIVLLQNMETAE